MNKFISITLLIILAFSQGYAQSFNEARLDSLVQILEKKDRFMGNITISENGKLLYSKTIGKADIETNKKNSIATKYRIGSVTKTFTSCLILKAVEEGKLALNQKINKYFPAVPNAGRISIENLLYHRSGIFNFTSNKDFLNYYTEPQSKKKMIERIADSKSNFDPDSAYEYSNSNYVLLSYILEETYKKSFSQILNEKIIRPLGLKNTYFGGKTNIKKNEAYSYSYKAGWTKENETDMSITMGAGCLISNSGDMVIFIEKLFANGIINQQSLDKMLHIKDNYGMGIVPFRFQDRRAYGHSGAIDGSSSALYYFADDKMTIAITSNGNELGTKYLMKAIASFYYDKPFEIPSFKTIEVTSEDLDLYIGEYITPEIPEFSIIISKDNLILTAQGTGEPAIPFDATEKHIFEFLRAGIKLEFTPTENKMVYSQGGQSFTMTKK